MKTIITTREMVRELGLPIKEIAGQSEMDWQVLRNHISKGTKVARLADGTFIIVSKRAKIYGKPAEDAAY